MLRYIYVLLKLTEHSYPRCTYMKFVYLLSMVKHLQVILFVTCSLDLFGPYIELFCLLEVELFSIVDFDSDFQKCQSIHYIHDSNLNMLTLAGLWW